jgi:hypothetical protein
MVMTNHEREIPRDPTEGTSAGTPANTEEDPTRGGSAGLPTNPRKDPTRGDRPVEPAPAEPAPPRQ